MYDAGIAWQGTGTDNRIMANRSTAHNEWQRRIRRADELGAQYGFAAEILRFYSAIARFQESFYRESLRSNADVGRDASEKHASESPFTRALPGELGRQFTPFLSVAEQYGPQPLQEAARQLKNEHEDARFELLAAFWTGSETGGLPRGPNDFFARAFLQPFAASLRERSKTRWTGPPPYLCPYCKWKPGLGVLRPLGDGGQRFLVCSFCLGEWEFRRIVCPGCGEENHAKLPVYTVDGTKDSNDSNKDGTKDDMKHIRVEACDSCRTYIKTVDMTTQGRAEPIVDEIASIPLDVWAQKQGYTKLQVNLMQL
jgi:FdhE protein